MVRSMTRNDSDPTPGRLPERPHPAPGDRRFVLNADGAAVVIQRGGQQRARRRASAGGTTVRLES
jgi:hypothetical protein